MSFLRVHLPPLSTWPARTQNLAVFGDGGPEGTNGMLLPATPFDFDPATNGNWVEIPIQGSYRYLTLEFSGNTQALGPQASEFEVWQVPTPDPAPSPSPSPERGVLPYGATQPAGTVHWLPGSAGRQVTFTASRYKPDGTLVQGTVTLTSPVDGRATAQPDSLVMYPTYCNVQNDRIFQIGGAGLQLFPSRHWGDGHYDDVRGSADLSYSCSDDRFQVSPTGLVTSKVLIPALTKVTFTVTDAKVPAGQALARPTATCTVTVYPKT